MIESGELLPKIDLIYKLSLILDVTIENLFHNEEYENLCLKKQEETIKKIANIYFNR